MGSIGFGSMVDRRIDVDSGQSWHDLHDVSLSVQSVPPEKLTFLVSLANRILGRRCQPSGCFPLSLQSWRLLRVESLRARCHRTIRD